MEKCDIKATILEVQPENCSCVVRFFTDNFQEGTITNITFYQDVIPTGQDLIDFILGQAPREWLYIKDATAFLKPDMSGVQAMVGLELVKTIAEQDAASTGPVEEPLPGEVIARALAV